jgi:hypothetical protein
MDHDDETRVKELLGAFWCFERLTTGTVTLDPEEGHSDLAEIIRTMSPEGLLGFLEEMPEAASRAACRMDTGLHGQPPVTQAAFRRVLAPFMETDPVRRAAAIKRCLQTLDQPITIAGQRTTLRKLIEGKR